jgi:hypothetical protein
VDTFGVCGRMQGPYPRKLLRGHWFPRVIHPRANQGMAAGHRSDLQDPGGAPAGVLQFPPALEDGWTVLFDVRPESYGGPRQASDW